MTLSVKNVNRNGIDNMESSEVSFKRSYRTHQCCNGPKCRETSSLGAMIWRIKSVDRNGNDNMGLSEVSFERP